MLSARVPHESVDRLDIIGCCQPSQKIGQNDLIEAAICEPDEQSQHEPMLRISG
jgi:hypothetical protein